MHKMPSYRRQAMTCLCNVVHGHKSCWSSQHNCMVERICSQHQANRWKMRRFAQATMSDECPNSFAFDCEDGRISHERRPKP